jgi:D-arginine dehydrogenase
MDARRLGTELRLYRLTAARHDAGGWHLDTRAGAFVADIMVVAAGAWADTVAALAGVTPLGIQPYRRTMVQLRTEPAPPGGLPHVGHLGGSFYFKPEGAGRLWLSPHDENETPPCDAQPEDLDVAIAIDRFEQVVDWRVAALERKWAGLRSFAPDRLPVYGFDAKVAGFFWCAGQGGFGIQTAPAAAKLAAAVLLGRSLPEEVAAIDPARYGPGRF